MCGSYNEISDWWKGVQNILVDSTNPFNALTAALACRAVTIGIQINKDHLQNSFKDDNGNEKEDEKNGNKLEKVAENKEKSSTSKEKDKNDDELVNTGDWEKVSKDTCQFSMLMGTLEDISVLDAVVR